MDTTAGLVRWDVPFAGAKDPSVSLITEQGGDAATLIVSPDGVDRYPKYLVRFDRVLAALCYEEALALNRGYPQAAGCACLWNDSPWLRASRGWAVDFLRWPDLRHYVVFGGDSIVELLASEPKIQQIDKKTVIETKHEV